MLPVRRTCRACGCWELRACEGGCAWIAADRCSACPDAALTLPINQEHVVSAMLLPVSQSETEFGWAITYQAREFPQLVVKVVRRPGHTDDVQVFVGAIEVPRDRADQMAEILNERREAA